MTNWDDYYHNPATATSITRKISEQKITSLINHNCNSKEIEICELGGANSCFAEGVCHKLSVSKYHIIDFNTYGLELLREKNLASTNLTWEKADVLKLPSPKKKYDLVYSVGLIEHFQPVDTLRAVASHFELCKHGGLVLITFPTPTVLYRLIRKSAELLGVWKFPDERPLSFAEVEKAGERMGRCEHKSINWFIGLTQGYLLWRKN